MRRALPLFLGGLAIALAALPARADVDACAASYEQAQRLRKAGNLRGARSELEKCAASCPKVLADDCTSWRADVDRALGKIAIDVRGGERCDRTRMQVFVDGESIARIQEPTAIEAGSHTVRVEASDSTRGEARVVVVSGETVSAKIDLPANACAPTTTNVEPPKPERTPERSVPLMTWILGGASIVLLGTGVVFLADGQSQRSDLDKTCKPFCDDVKVDEMQRSFLIGDLFAGAGILALAGAAVVYFVDRR